MGILPFPGAGIRSMAPDAGMETILTEAGPTSGKLSKS